nr:hypothetical protein [Paenibacillus mucilaginosus]
MIPSEYNDEIKAIDESILKLLMERMKITKGKRYFPPREIVKQWAADFDMEIAQIIGTLHSLTEGDVSHQLPAGPGKLLTVLPLMKSKILDGFEYELTHAMQHENGSIVFLEITLRQLEENIGHIRPQLLLMVNGPQPYNIRRNGAHGGGGHSQLSFLVTPRLPDDIAGLEFSLIPYARPMESRPKEVILNQEISF